MTITAARSSVKPKPTFTVLIVDDNRDFVEFLKFLLSHDGFNIRWAFNTEAGAPRRVSYSPFLGSLSNLT